LATIVLMAASTSASSCLMRIPRSLALRERTLSPRTLAMMENVAGYAVIAVIAPAFIPGKLAKLLAVAVTPLAAMRLPLLPTVIIGVAATGCPPHIFG